MTIVIKIRDEVDLERSGDVLAARKKRGILLVKNVAIAGARRKIEVNPTFRRALAALRTVLTIVSKIV
jgi:hypothetical protein